MKPRLLKLAMPSLQLSPEEQCAVVEEFEALLAETLAHERQFRSSKVSLDKKHWKEIKSHEDFRVYKERKQKNADPADMHRDTSPSIMAPRFLSMRELPIMSTSTVDSSEGDLGFVASVKDPKVPMVVAAGHVEGALKDIVFGALASDDTSWRLRAAYMKDKTSDSKVLATIVAPTEADPYTCLCIKWFMREIPGYLSPFVHSRDFLVMEATGIAVDEYGERYGYYFLHEFHHPLLPVLNARKILRCGISQGYISRQVRPDKVHFFTRGFVDPRGDVPVSIAVQLSAETTVAATSTAETSYTKKLGWLMARERHRRRQTLTTPRTTCSCNHSKSSSLLACQVYAECFCSRCVVQKKFVVDMTTSEVIERVLPFFFGCVLKAKEMSPHEVAVDTVVRPRSCLQTPTGSSTY